MLRDKGFDPGASTAGAAEGLLPYLPSDAQDLLFRRMHELSVPGSPVAVEAFTPKFFDEDLIGRRRSQMERLRAAAGDAGEQELPDAEQLFYFGERADVADRLRDQHWEVAATEAEVLMASYGRPAPSGVEDATLPSVFVERRLK